MPSMTYEELLNRALGRISANVDKTEGSLIYDAVAPCITELYEAYLYMDELEKRVYADTSYNEYLDRRCAERGIYRRESTHATRKGEFDNDVPIGSRWGIEELVYIVISKIKEGEFLLQCEDAGVIGNRYKGDLINMDGIQGITVAKLTDIAVPAQNEEDDESLRKRFFDSFDREAFGGNIADYEEKVGAIDGVGHVKVFPIWNGGGTVKIMFLDSDNNIPNSLLVDKVQDLVDPTVNSGQGLGIAPIGHVVTVLPPTGVNIDVSMRLTLVNTSWDAIRNKVTEVIEKYFNDLRSKWKEQAVIVRIAQIESRILDVEGVLDIRDTTLNGAPDNISLSSEEVPKLNGVINL